MCFSTIVCLIQNKVVPLHVIPPERIMLDLTFTYHTATEDITITGFIAYLLQQGEDWDIRCLEADARDYHAQQYARMHPTIALQQELQWWLDFVDEERLELFSLRDELINAGLSYLQWRVHEQITPLSDSDKLNTDMAIRLDEQHELYKAGDALGLFDQHTQAPLLLIHGFPAQLLTYAAATTMDMYILQEDITHPIEWVESIIGWLQSPPTIWMNHVQFAIPDVYQLYETYLANALAQWEVDNRRRYQSGLPQTRYFMTRLLEQTQMECEEAARCLSEYLSVEQSASFARYLTECQQFIQDRVKTKRKERSDELRQYYNSKTGGKSRHLITRRLHEAVMHPTAPAAELAKVVKQMISQKVLVADIRPHTHFIRVINKTFATDINHDSFSKHFRRR